MKYYSTFSWIFSWKLVSDRRDKIQKRYYSRVNFGQGMSPLLSLRPDEQNKSEIARIAAKASERDNIKAEVRSMERADAAKRNTEAAGACIRAREEAETAKIKRAEAEARGKNRRGRGRLQRPR